MGAVRTVMISRLLLGRIGRGSLTRRTVLLGSLWIVPVGLLAAVAACVRRSGSQTTTRVLESATPTAISNVLMDSAKFSPTAKVPNGTASSRRRVTAGVQTPVVGPVGSRAVPVHRVMPPPVVQPSPWPTSRPRPSPATARTPKSASSVTDLDVGSSPSEFTEDRLWAHWDAAQAFFVHGLINKGAAEFREAIAIAFAQGRADIGEFLVLESLDGVGRFGGAERLVQTDLGGRASGWLPRSTRDRIRARANTVYRNVMGSEAKTAATSTVAALLGQLRVIRASSGLVGLHWPDPGRTYRDGTPFVERVVIFSADGTEYHRERVRMRVAKLRNRHPNSTIVLRIDFRPDQVIPRTAADRNEYYRQLEHVISAPEFQGLILQQGNEPQFEGNPSPAEAAREFNGFGLDVSDTGNFWSRCDMFNPTALRLPMPVAPFHPDGPDDSNPPAVEDSPWARMSYQMKRAILEVGVPRGRVPSAWAEHVYGDPRPEVPGAEREAWFDTREATAGFRWTMNVAETWQGINATLEQDFGLAPLPVWITEFNTAARGITSPHQPADNYVEGWMIHALSQLTCRMPTLVGACWFVGDSYNHDAQWTRFAIHENHGRMPAAERDLEVLQALGV